MRGLFFIKLIICFSVYCGLSCSSYKVNKTCNENKEFRKVFFKKIENVEKYFLPFLNDSILNLPTIESILISRNDTFMNSLKFISKYATVSWGAMANYDHSYPIGIFQKDKKEWLDWYEANKCNNIQFK